MESLHHQVNALHLDGLDPQFTDKLDIFDDPTKPINGKSYFDSFLKYSQKADTAQVLFQLLQKNVDGFLKVVAKLHDRHGAIIINVLTLSPDKQHWVEQILTNLKNFIKNKLVDHDFYLLVYLGMVNEFKIVVPHHLPIFLNLLVPTDDDDNLQAIILFIVVKNLELQQLPTLDAIQNFYDYILETESNYQTFLNLVTSLNALFPIVPSVCTKIYTSSLCKQVIEQYVSKISPNSLNIDHNQLMAKSLLKLVSSSCIDDECRKFNSSNYLDLLNTGKNIEMAEIKVLSALCIVKLWNFLQNEKVISITELYEIGLQYLKSNDDNHLEYCIELFAYLTLNPSIRIKLRSDELVIEKLVSIIKSKSSNEISNSHSSIIYGLLLILSNLMNIKDTSQELKTKNYLKAMANPNSSNDKTKENIDDIHNFNKSLISQHKIVDLLSKLKIIKVSKNGSNNNTDQFITIIYLISTNQTKSVRQDLVKQGAINILLDYLILTSKVMKEEDNQTRPLMVTENNIDIRLKAIRSLAKILILVNPALSFNKYSIITVIPFLVELLGPDISNYSPGLTSNNDDNYLYNNITNLDKYESLLALTNISSIDEDKNDIKTVIINKTFDKYLNNFIIENDFPELLKSSWELISNLINKPGLLVKFFNLEDNQAKKRLNLLIKLLELDDLNLQIILAGLLANATSEFDMIPQVLIQNTNLKIEITNVITRLTKSQATDTELMLRLCYLLLDLVYGAANLDIKELEYFKSNNNLKSSLNHLLKLQKNKQVLEVLVEIIKFVKFN